MGLRGGLRRLRADVARPGAGGALGRLRRLPSPAVHRARARARGWFREQAAARGLRLEADGFGNVVAWWDRGLRAGGVLTGSHLDSVLDGGAYDGPLGVVSALAAIDVLRSGASCRPGRSGSRCSWRRRARGSGWPAWARGWRPARCRGSARGAARRDGVGLGDVVEGGPGLLRGRHASWSCTSSRAATWSTAGLRSGWPAASGRTGATASTSPGEANHAGTTRMEDRTDPMLTYAMTALAANKQARLPTSGRRSGGSRSPQRHQRCAVAGHGLARRPRLDGRLRSATWWRISRQALARRARRHRARGHRRVGLGLCLRSDLAASLAADRAEATGRCSPPPPATTRASSRPRESRRRCSSSATQPASATRRRDLAIHPTAWGRCRTRWPRRSSGWRT